MRRPVAAAAAMLVLAACGTASAPAAAGPDGDAGVTAVASVYPLAWIAEQVAPNAEVVALAADGQDPHDLELTPGQQSTLERADVVVHLGHIGFQPHVERAVSSATGNVVDAAAVIGAQHLRPLDDTGAGQAEESADGPWDPHVWFDARLMTEVAHAAGSAFADVDPPNRSEYLANAERVAADLEETAEEIEGLLASCRHDEVVVSHEAYAYLLAPHGLQQLGVSGAAGHDGASPREIADLAARVRAEDLSAVLTEPVEGRTDAEAVAAEAGVEVIEILSLDIVDESRAGAGFPDLLVEQARAVAQAAECAL